MTMLSEDDRSLRGLSDEDVARAWDLWFDLAQATNDADPPYTHGVFQLAEVSRVVPGSSAERNRSDESADRVESRIRSTSGE